MQGYAGSALRQSSDAIRGNAALHRSIPLDVLHSCVAENPAILVAQVTAGTRCYAAEAARPHREDHCDRVCWADFKGG